jgi:type II pantothenate kinase
MGIIVGLDIGGSTTKIVGLSAGQLISKELVKASDPVASAFGALGKFISQNNLALTDIERVMVTGVGASFLRGNLLEIQTVKTAEFRAIGLGGLFITGLPEAIVVSMGTGTAIVKATPQGVEHLIGSGIGGGTLLGLSSRMLNVRDFDIFCKLADQGDLSKIDLSVGDITRDGVQGLPPETTASNFGRVNDQATPEDIALGIVNLVFQSIGTSAVMAARQGGLRRIIFTGNLMLVSAGKRVLESFSRLYGVDIIMPDSAEFATAVGAALCPL